MNAEACATTVVHESGGTGESPRNALPQGRLSRVRRALVRDFPRERIGALLVFLSSGVGTGGWIADIPRIRQALALSSAELGFALPGFGAGALAATLLAGHLAKRFGSRTATMTAACLFLLAATGPAFAPSHVWLIAALLAFGFSVGALDVSMNAHGSEIEQRLNRPLMSSFFGANSVGQMLGAMTGACVAAVGGSARAGMLGPLLLAVFLMVLSWIVGLRLPRRAVSHGHSSPKETADDTSPSMAPAASKSAGTTKAARGPLWLRWTGLWLTSLMLGLSTALVMALQGAVGDWGGIYLSLVVGVSDATATLGFGCFSIALACTRLLGDRMVILLGARRLVRLGSLAAVAGYALLLAFPGVTTACIGFAVIGFGIGNILPILMSAVGRLGKHPTTAIGIAMMIGYGGAMIAPVLLGIASEQVGLRLAMVGLLGVSLLLATAAASCVGYAGRLEPEGADA